MLFFFKQNSSSNFIPLSFPRTRLDKLSDPDLSLADFSVMPSRCVSFRFVFKNFRRRIRLQCVRARLLAALLQRGALLRWRSRNAMRAFNATRCTILVLKILNCSARNRQIETCKTIATEEAYDNFRNTSESIALSTHGSIDLSAK